MYHVASYEQTPQPLSHHHAEQTIPMADTDNVILQHRLCYKSMQLKMLAGFTSG